jgi:hypothetical protein
MYDFHKINDKLENKFHHQYFCKGKQYFIKNNKQPLIKKN